MKYAKPAQFPFPARACGVVFQLRGSGCYSLREDGILAAELAARAANDA